MRVSPGPTVVKIGGNELDDADWVRAFCGIVAREPRPMIVVHGGGKEVTALQRRLGAEPEWRHGLRVTTEETLRAVTMALSGTINKRLVAALIDAGVPAVGISGEDGSLINATPAMGGALGRTGEVSEVRPRLIHALLASGMVPVVSPVSRGPEGGALNVNADDAAAALASALAAERLLLISDVPGVLVEGRALEELNSTQADRHLRSGVVAGGMGPKIRAAFRAAASGVPEVRIGDLHVLTGAAGGTRLRAPVALAATA